MFDSMLFLTDEDVQQTMTVAEAVDLADRGIRADAEGLVAGGKFYMAVGEGGYHAWSETSYRQPD